MAEFEAGADGQPDLYGAGGRWDDLVDPGADWDPREVPDDTDAWLASLPDDIRAEVLADRPSPWDADGEAQPRGFADGALFDTALPGPLLGQALSSVTAFGHSQLGEGELLGVLRGWQRQAAYAQAGLAAAAIALAGRRAAGSSQAAEHLVDEVAIELTLTGRSARRLLDMVAGLRRLGAVHEALLSGVIDWARACVFVDELAVLAADAVAQAIAGDLIGPAEHWTTAQLRVALVRAVLAVDPGAAERRKKAARKDTRVEVWGESSGNAALAGRELRPAHVIAIDKQLTGYAHWLKSCGVPGSVDQLRSLAYTTLLSGRELAGILDDPSCWPRDDGDIGGRCAGAAAASSCDGECATTGDSAAHDGATHDGATDGAATDDGGSAANGSRGNAGAGGDGCDRNESAGGDGRDGNAGAAGGGRDGSASGGSGRDGNAGAGGDGRDANVGAGGDGCNGSAGADGNRSRAGGAPERGRGSDSTGGDLPGDQDSGACKPGGDRSRVTGVVHLTMPVWAWLGGGEPGEVAGHGPVDAATSRELAGMLGRDPRTRWCLTLTGPAGIALGHACAGRGRGPSAGEPVIRWAAGLRDKMQLFETGTCGHGRQSAGYTPSAALRHLIEVRQRTCGAPGCRRPARRCDLDHTQPFEQGGRTCECNLAPLCRTHHRAKQAPGWHLTQDQPGVMTWRLPSGRGYQTTGPPYPG